MGKRAGLTPGTRSGLWSHMAEAIDALQPRLVVIENVRGLLSSPTVRTSLEGDDDAQRNPDHATSSATTFAFWNPTRGAWETSQLDLYGQPAPYSAIWPTCGTTHNGSAYQHPLSALLTPDFASSSSLTAKALFRTPLATDSTRGGESLEQVRATRGTIALSHQIIDLTLNGPTVNRPGFRSVLQARMEPMNQKYSPEMRGRALRMLDEAKPEHPNLMSAVRHVAGLLGMSPETLRVWHRRREIDAGQRPGVPTDVAEENKRLRRENAELKKANEVLKAASVFFAKELDRP